MNKNTIFDIQYFTNILSPILKKCTNITFGRFKILMQQNRTITVSLVLIA